MWFEIGPNSPVVATSTSTIHDYCYGNELSMQIHHPAHQLLSKWNTMFSFLNSIATANNSPDENRKQKDLCLYVFIIFSFVHYVREFCIINRMNTDKQIYIRYRALDLTQVLMCHIGDMSQHQRNNKHQLSTNKQKKQHRFNQYTHF